MVPSQQRFDPDQGEVVDVVDRLVVQFELAALARVVQLRFDLQQLARGLMHLRTERLVAVGSVCLGAVEREIGIAEQLLVGRHERRRRCRHWQ